jgi:predicted dehydrogenase
VGFGKVAEMAHIPAFAARRDFQIVAVADPLPERRERAKGLLPRARLYEQAEELLAREAALDFVDICTPPKNHTPLALAALDRGCHVTVHNWKHAPLLAQAGALARSGGIGALQMVEWGVHRTSGGGGGLTAWRQEGGQGLGGILIDHGWHAFYLLMEWAEAVPKALNARLIFADQTGVEQEAEVRLRFPTCQARMFLTWQAGERRNWGRLSGSKGEILMEDDRLVLAPTDLPAETRSFPAKVSAGSHHPDWMGGVLDEFSGEISNSNRRGRNLREAELCALLIRLAYRSHQEGGKWVDVQPHETPH